MAQQQQRAPWQAPPRRRRSTQAGPDERQPETGDAMLDAQQAPGGGNQAALMAMQTASDGGAQAAPSGPMVRVFNRIRGTAESADVQSGAFDRKQLHGYLDKTLQLAAGEWFRGKKLDGVADKLIAQLDTDGSQTVGWAEFEAFEAQTLSALTGKLAPGATDAQIASAAKGRFSEVDGAGKEDGQASYDELRSSSKAQLPAGTEHAGLIAQLAARIALDAVDTDQRDTGIKDRSLSQDEWVAAAQQMAANQQQ